MKKKQVELTQAQIAVLTKNIALIMNDPDWHYEPGEGRSLLNAFKILDQAERG